MAVMRKCPECGSSLDPGERCDCGEGEKVKAERQRPVKPGRTKRRHTSGASENRIGEAWEAWDFK